MMNDSKHRTDAQTNSTPNVFEANLTRSLEQAPAVVIPADFAARVRASLPPQPAPRRATSNARTAAIAAAALLTVAMFFVAPHAQACWVSLSFYIEMLMLAELFGIAYWLVVRPSVRS